MTPNPFPLTAAIPSIADIREAFPALASETIFLENAGGSQVPACVADAIREYMLNTYVQLEANYELSRRCTDLVHRAHTFVEMFMNASEPGCVILGSSSTALATILGDCYRRVWNEGDEIVIARCGHETNISPWVRLAEDVGATLHWWQPDSDTTSTTVDGLEPFLNERTRIVALPHVSNLLGEIIDVKAVTEAAHRVGARVVVDGVAYAPHRAIDVQAWDVDYYFFSTYKVYGPHMAALYGGREALAEITGPNHFFVPRNEIPYKFELGGCSHESCAGLLALGEYLSRLAGCDETETVTHETVRTAYATMTALELPMQARLLDYLCSKPQVRIIGPGHADESRVGTISFIHESKSSREVSDSVNAQGIGIRYGHMYAYRLCEALGLDPEDGVVRVSLVHYNTIEEIDRLIGVLDEIL